MKQIAALTEKDKNNAKAIQDLQKAVADKEKAIADKEKATAQ
jgi:hypothetical protein